MNRLWVRLSLAFTLVTMVTLAVVTVAANQRAGTAFQQYISYSSTGPGEALVASLGSYYAHHGTFRGAESLLVGAGREPMPVRRTWRAPSLPMEMQPQVVLADAAGRVLFDSTRPSAGRALTHDENAAAMAVTVGDQVVGQVVVSFPVNPALLGPLEQRYASRLREVLLTGAVLAGGLAVLLGVAFSRSLSAPLQRLAAAARAVANRDFSQRVQASGGAELAAVATAFNDMAGALEQAEQLRKNLMADVAHELRTPLSVVQGGLQAILDDVYPLEKAEVARLYGQTRLLNRLVDDLRLLALADAGQLTMNVQDADAATLVRTAAQQLSTLAEEQGVTLTAASEEGLPAVRADPDRVAQVLHNLVQNSLNHTPAGGSITLTAALAGDQVEVAVADTGEGIAPEYLPHIFERFWRADPSRWRDEGHEGGSGLGLSIAQSLVKAQGGRIWAESKPGRGATFRFTLPLAEGETGSDV